LKDGRYDGKCFIVSLSWYRYDGKCFMVKIIFQYNGDERYDGKCFMVGMMGSLSLCLFYVILLHSGFYIVFIMCHYNV